MVCFAGRGTRGKRRSINSNGAKTGLGSVGERAPESEGDAPVGQRCQPVGRDRRSREVPREVLQAVAVIRGDTDVRVQAEPSTVAQRRPAMVAAGLIPDPTRSVLAPRRGPVAATPATEALASVASTGSALASARRSRRRRARPAFARPSGRPARPPRPRPRRSVPALGGTPPRHSGRADRRRRSLFVWK